MKHSVFLRVGLLFLTLAFVLAGCGSDQKITAGGGGHEDASELEDASESDAHDDDAGDPDATDGSESDGSEEIDPPTPPNCGDGIVQAEEGEVCDDGLLNGTYGACALNCLGPGPHCGDGTVNGDETCDDGMNDGTYGRCLPDCSGKGPYCGDGIVNGDEVCDDGVNAGQYGDRGACMAGCMSFAPYCGDLRVTDGEACDDGQNDSIYGGGCMAGCLSVSPRCGDGATNPPYETCDDGSANGTYGHCNRNCSALGPRCGDGIVQQDQGETCDDGNSIDGDGCSSTCQIESGFTCSVQGLACQRIPVCGDGFISSGEVCDEGSAPASGGCTDNCTTQDPHYLCVAGQTCQLMGVCGDGIVWPLTEECDEGMALTGGCINCKIQPGWLCPSAGGRCSAARCGDGIIAGNETCDPPGLGCDVNCQRIEGYACGPSGCHKTVCGDGIVEGDEACDFGALGNLWDQQNGCTPGCTWMLDCPLQPSGLGSACSAPCGSGMLLPTDTKECDDGNLQEGDGCNELCEIEDGWSCQNVSTAGDTMELPVVFRDFVGKGLNSKGNAGWEHSDFENFSGSGTSRLVQQYLDADRKPQWHSNTGYGTTTQQLNGTALFQLWYRDDPCVNSATPRPCNSTVATTLTLTRNANGTYSYSDASFLPFSNRSGVTGTNYTSVQAKSLVTLGYEKNTGGYDFGFTSEIRYWFEFQGNEKLDFTGDDDVWVFINNRMALDLGGLHSEMSGSVRLSLDTDGKTGIVETQGFTWNNGGAEGFTPTMTTTGWRTAGTSFELEKGKVYEIVLFHAERHSTGSNFKLTLGGFNSVRSHCTPSCGDGKVVGNEVCDEGTANNTGAYNHCLPDCSGWGPRCGDGIINGTEACDDGPDNGRYGRCAADCSGPAPRCGDGTIDHAYGELCDDGPLNGTYGHCAADCRSRASYCGDGTLDAKEGEECDEGPQNGANTIIDPDNPSCTSDCKLLTHFCGDGVVTSLYEVCDDGMNVGVYGKDQCMPGCQGFAPYCGDGDVDTLFGEVCDDGVNTGHYGQPGACMPGCRSFAPYCGDSIVNGSEVCDDGVNAGQYGDRGACMAGCMSFAPYCGDRKVTDGEGCDDGVNDGRYGGCLPDCSARAPRCGDGNVDADFGEVCDDGRNDGRYGGCMPGCKTLAPYCGDGVMDTLHGEQCDEGDLNGTNMSNCTATCQRLFN